MVRGLLLAAVLQPACGSPGADAPAGGAGAILRDDDDPGAPGGAEGEGDAAPEGEGEGEGEGQGTEQGGAEGGSAGEGEGEDPGGGEGEGEGEGDGEVGPGDGGGGPPADPAPVAMGECNVQSLDGRTCHLLRERSIEEVCGRLAADYPERAALPLWTAHPEGGCGPGTVAPASAGDALRRIDLYRWLAGLPPLTADPGLSEVAQQCAEMQTRAGELSHDPPPDWPCRTAQGALAASRSNLSIGQASAAAAVDSQIIDGGEANRERLGHRRWLLYRPLATTGVGFSRAGPRPATCVHVVPDPFVVDEARGAGSLTIWPPPGPAPFEVVNPANLRGEPLRWSVTAPDADFSDAPDVRVVREAVPGAPGEADTPVPADSGRLQALFDDGLWIEPQIPIEAGATYRVEVRGIVTPADAPPGTPVWEFAWRTTFVDCGLVVPDLCDPIAQDCPLPRTGCYGLEDPACKNTELPDDGVPCEFDRQCPAGATCVEWAAGQPRVCAPYCSALPPGGGPGRAPVGRDCPTVCGPAGHHVLDAARGWAICRAG